MNKQELYKEIENHYRNNYKRLVKMLSNLVGSIHNAEDVVQTTYLRSLDYWKSFEEGSNIDAWIRQILRNCIIDKIKDERNHGMIDDLENEVIYPTITDKKLLEKIGNIIEAQKEPVKKILKLHFIDEYSCKDIANIVPESYNNIRVIVHRFRQDIKQKYNND